MSRKSGIPCRLVDILRGLYDRRHFERDPTIVDPARPHHLSQNIWIEHPMHRDSVGSCFDAGHLPDGVHQRLPVMRAGAAHQRSIDVKQNQIHCGARR